MGTDRRFLERPTLAVLYSYLVPRLHFTEFRRVRASRIATDLGVRPETVGDALRVLREAGYIERGPRLLDVFTYRLVYARSGATENAPKVNLA